MSGLEPCTARSDHGPDLTFQGRVLSHVEGWASPNEWLVMTLFEAENALLVLEVVVKNLPTDPDASYEALIFQSFEALLGALADDRVSKQLRSSLGYPTSIPLSELKFTTEGPRITGQWATKTRH